MEQAKKTAKVLIEALPYIREFHGQTVVIKYGGHAMKDEALKQAFAKNIVLLKYIGVNPVIVHGGGPQIGKMLEQLGIVSEFKDGLRVTDQATMDVVEMVLVGRVNKEIVNLLNQSGGNAVGLSGKDGQCIKARKLTMVKEHKDAAPEILDLGQVGEVVSVDTTVIRSLERDDFIPVIAPIGVGDDGLTYNINADTAAAAVAGALKAKRLILLTDVPGIMDAENNIFISMSESDALKYIENGTIKGGMIPKVKCCLDSLRQGVEKSFIIDGRLENVVLLELFTNAGVGTEIVADPAS